MCGIAGIIGRLGDPNRAALRRMADALSHRGPDGCGYWEGTPDDRGDGCLMAHRRLSILDLTECASQPMVDPVTGQAIVFNGEIYNFQELRGDLQRQGHRFDSTGDTAVMLRHLAVNGYAAVDKLRGMFAFALWDDVLRRLVVGRDPLGIKPLYVCRNPDPDGSEWTFVFASEVRSILASGLLSGPRLSPAAVSSMVWNGYVMGPSTVIDGIESVSAGEYRVIDARGREVEAKTYWSLGNFGQGDRDEADLARVLEESVRQHLVSDVPLGVFLSGGIDSSAVANLAQRALRTGGDGSARVRTFCLAFEEEKYNEGVHARRIAEAIGTEHHEIMMTQDRFVRDLDAALDSLDQPSFDALNSYCISRAVREAGLTVALVGTGGDELFGGYASFRQLPRLHRLSAQTSWMPGAVKMTAARAVAAMAGRRSSSAAVAPQTRWAKLPGMVEDADDMIALYQMAYALFLPDFQEQLLLNPRWNSLLFRGVTRSAYDRLRHETGPYGRLGAVSAIETRCFLGQRLLRDTDATSMGVSLEVRTPLVDSVVVETAFRMREPERFLPLGRKEILRRAGLKGLDPALFERPKSGFVMPFDRWIRSALGGRMNEVMRDERAAKRAGLDGRAVSRLWQAYQDGAPGMYWSRVWGLYVLIWWANRYKVSV